MVMGPTHAMSGAAAWMAACTAGALPAMSSAHPSVVLAGAAVAAGSALLPDLDCPGSLSPKDGSTVVRAFGVVGEAVGHALSNVSLAVYNLTASRYDKPRTSGHRTLTHTLVFTAGVGAMVAWLGSITATFTAAGNEWMVSQVATWLAMFTCLHLALYGLAEKWAKTQRAKYGLIPTMLLSAIATTATIAHLPAASASWLGLAVGFGAVMHLLGDAITKQGVPVLWPTPIAGKHWYDVSLPSALRITAGGTFEKALLLPALSIVTGMLLVTYLPGGSTVLQALTSASGR